MRTAVARLRPHLPAELELYNTSYDSCDLSPDGATARLLSGVRAVRAGVSAAARSVRGGSPARVRKPPSMVLFVRTEPRLVRNLVRRSENGVSVGDGVVTHDHQTRSVSERVPRGPDDHSLLFRAITRCGRVSQKRGRAKPLTRLTMRATRRDTPGHRFCRGSRTMLFCCRIERSVSRIDSVESEPIGARVRLQSERLIRSTTLGPPRVSPERSDSRGASRCRAVAVAGTAAATPRQHTDADFGRIR
jgi:hypothetical protein